MYKEEYDLAVEAALKAGAYLKDKDLPRIDSQTGKDIKLSSDKKSEEIIINILRDTDIPILSEECGVVGEKKASRVWIIDPLDGTANYWRGMKELACVSVALWENGEPVLGVVNRFQQGELFSGIVGEGAWMNGEVIHTSTTSHISDAVLATGFPVKRDYGSESLQSFIGQVQKFKKVRMLGAAAVMGAFVAAGRVDVYAEDQIMLWDIAASSAIVKAAGGVADILPLESDQCICRLYANESLYEEYNQLESRVK